MIQRDGKLTEDASNGIPAVSFEVEKRWYAYNELIEQAAEGPKVRLTTILLLKEELRRRVLHRSKECRR